MWWYVLEPSNRFYMILRSSLKQHIWNRRNLVSYVVRCQNASKVSRCECGSSDHPSSETICCPGPVKTRIVRSDGIWIFQKTREECDKNQKHNTCHTSLLVKIGVFFFSSVPNLRRSVEKQHKTSLQTNEISLFYCPKSENYEGFLEFIVFIWLLYLIVFKPEDSFVSTPDSLDRFVFGPLANVEVDLHHRRLHQFNLGGDIRRLRANIRRYIVTHLPVWKSGSSKTLSQSTFLTNKLIQI